MSPLTKYLILVNLFDLLEKLALIGHNHFFDSSSIVNLLLKRSQNDQEVFDDGYGWLGKYVLPGDVDFKFANLSAFHFDWQIELVLKTQRNLH